MSSHTIWAVIRAQNFIVELQKLIFLVWHFSNNLIYCALILIIEEITIRSSVTLIETYITTVMHPRIQMYMFHLWLVDPRFWILKWLYTVYLSVIVNMQLICNLGQWLLMHKMNTKNFYILYLKLIFLQWKIHWLRSGLNF